MLDYCLLVKDISKAWPLSAVKTVWVMCNSFLKVQCTEPISMD